jgi:hypothetical protein
MIFTICLFDNAFAENVDNKQWKNYFLDKVINNNSSKSDQLFKFQLQVQNGIIDKITQNSEFEGLVANISGSGNDTLEIKFPRNYPFMQGYNNMSEHYTPNVSFLINKMEGNYTVSTSNCFFVYSVPFSSNSEVDMLIVHPLISNLPNMYHGDNISSSCNVQTIVSYMLPLKQINAGVDPKSVQCIAGLVIVLHPENKVPVCVKPDTANILLERGWAKTL